MLNLALQEQLEVSMLTEAKARQTRDDIKTDKRGAWSDSKLGSRYVKLHTQAFVAAVNDFVNQPNQEARRMNRAAEFLKGTGLDAQTISFLFVKALYNQVPKMKNKPIKRVTMCIRLADMIHDEWRIRHFSSSENRRNLLKKLCKDFDKRQYPRYWRLKTIKNYFFAEQLEWQGWTTREKLHVGYALLILFRDTTDLVETNSTSKYVTLRPEFLAHMEAQTASRVQDFMLYLPMVVPPRPWKEEYLYRGGYLSSKNVRPFPIIKGARKRDVERMNSMDWSRIIPPLNALQETAWRVNKDMVDLLDWAMFNRGGGFAGLPFASPVPLPPEPEGYRTDDEVKRKHNHKCFLIHDQNRRAISGRLAVFFTLSLAKKFQQFPAIFFPHNLDTRGRAYPLPAFLNPQGADWCKSLLEFSRGIPIENDEQAAWLAVAGANAYGNDKVALQERVDWVQDNEEMIFSIAADPVSDLRWQDASEPFQFVRFCKEWAAFWSYGYGYVSHMVVPVDATCSGLQHYAALLRDEIGGKSVNLIPGFTRQDIYGDVANKVVEKLFRESSQFPIMARDWIKFGIDRKITKRQVMVVPYAGTFSSCMEYTREAVAEKLASGVVCPWDTTVEQDHRDRVVFLSRLIWEAIDEVVVKGKEAMRWLSEVARSYTKEANKLPGSAHSKRMTWHTPDGFEVIHFRPAMSKQRVETVLDGRLRLTYYEDTARLETKDMALAVAPNFVHSLDACHLRMSVMKGLEQGITEFGMVHDSFGVHAARMPRFLRDCVKPAFIDMYKDDVLGRFYESLTATGLSIPTPPSMGSLDITGVQESEFFFS
jgi:DNA-directed RNA polymerase